jgi:hypothetical protein
MQNADPRTALLEQLAAYHERNRQFAQRVQQFSQWLAEYRAQLEDLHRRLHAQRHTVDPPATTSLTAPSDVTDAQWERVAPVLTIPQTRGRPYVDARRTLNGIHYVLATGCGWNHLPERYGNYVTCWRRLLRWKQTRAWATATRLLDLAEVHGESKE